MKFKVEINEAMVQNGNNYHMKIALEPELWSVWPGDGEILSNKKTRCQASRLTVNRLKAFYTKKLNTHCLSIIS